MKISALFEQQYLPFKKSRVENIARQLISAAGSQLYQEGRKPTSQEIGDLAKQAANRIPDLVHKAIDEQIRTKNAKKIN